jgi:two-component system alkaline phosphatase synthesis response regulator PhoP
VAKKILIVDDDPDILELLFYNLVKQGYEVRIIENPQYALSACLSFLPDLIILDVMMPEINGLALCKEIRLRALFKETQIFFLSSRSESFLKEAAIRSGGDEYIEKLSGIRTLSEKIATNFQGR